MKEGGRFTAWFSATERAALNAEAELEGTTVNWVVRKAVRRYLGKDKLKAAAETVMGVTGNKS